MMRQRCSRLAVIAASLIAVPVIVMAVDDASRITTLRHDPFKPPPPIAVPAPPPVARALNNPKPVAPAPKTLASHHILRGTIVANANRFANISGTIVGVGDSYEGFVIVDIGERSVTLAHGDSKQTLSLDNE